MTKIIEINYSSLEDIIRQMNDTLGPMQDKLSNVSLGVSPIGRMRRTEFIGQVNEAFRSVMWPPQEKFDRMDSDQLSHLKLKKIEWTTGTVIGVLKFTLSDGTESIDFGESAKPSKECKTFSDDVEFSKIEVYRDKHWLGGMRFYGKDGLIEFEFKGRGNDGDWEELAINDGERIIGVSVEIAKHPKAISFTLYKP